MFSEGHSVRVKHIPSVDSRMYRKTGVVMGVLRREAVTNSDGKRALGERRYIVKFDEDAIGEMTMFEGQLAIQNYRI